MVKTLNSLIATVALMCVTILSVGCSTPTGLVRVLEPHMNRPMEVVCDLPCETEWQRAQLWIVNYGAWVMTTATDVVIQTANAPGSEPRRVLRATKTPIGDGVAVIQLGQSCPNIFGCSPPTDREVAVAFLHYVEFGEDLFAASGAYISID